MLVQLIRHYLSYRNASITAVRKHNQSTEAVKQRRGNSHYKTNKEKQKPQTKKKYIFKNPQNTWKQRKKYKVEVSFMTLIHVHSALTREC